MPPSREDFAKKKLEKWFKDVNHERSQKKGRGGAKSPEAQRKQSKTRFALRQLPHITNPDPKATAGDILYTPTKAQIELSAKLLVDAKKIQEKYFTHNFAGVKKEDLVVKFMVASTRPTKGAEVYSVIKDAVLKKLANMHLGAVDTAIQFGPVILEWNRKASLIVPARTVDYCNDLALSSIDLEFGDSKQRVTEDVIPAICQLIAEWNGTKEYNITGANSQKFTEALLSVMKLKPLSDAEKIFLDGLSKADMSKELEFQHTFSNGEKYTFKNHADLDKECANLDVDADSADYKILKSYDRMFWLRYYAIVDGEGGRIHQTSLELYKPYFGGCPFSDPEDTGSRYGARNPKSH